MNILLALSRAVDALIRSVGKLTYWLVLMMAVISAGNAVMRYTFNVGSNAWLEIQWYLFAAVFMLCAPAVLARNEHVRVDIFYGRLPIRGQIWVDLIGGLLFLLPAALILLWLSWPMFWAAWSTLEASGNAGGLIRWPVELMLPLGFALLMLQGVSEIIKRIAMLSGHLAADLHYDKPLQ